MFGIEVGDGWKPLYQPILDRIKEINKETGSEIFPTQVKEKFGILEVYLSEYTPELEKMIQEASEKSSHVCENCGRPAKHIIMDGWYYPFCKKCYKQYLEKVDKILKSYENQIEQGEQNLHQEAD